MLQLEWLRLSFSHSLLLAYFTALSKETCTRADKKNNCCSGFCHLWHRLCGWHRPLLVCPGSTEWSLKRFHVWSLFSYNYTERFCSTFLEHACYQSGSLEEKLLSSHEGEPRVNRIKSDATLKICSLKQTSSFFYLIKVSAWIWSSGSLTRLTRGSQWSLVVDEQQGVQQKTFENLTFRQDVM